VRNGNLLKSRISEISIKPIHVNQGVGVVQFMTLFQIFENNDMQFIKMGP
jgi:hypothetical protein